MPSVSVPPQHPLSFLLWCFVPHRKWAVIAICAVALAAVTSRAQLYLLKVVIDVASTAREHGISTETLISWALCLPLLYYVNEWMWRVSGFSGMRWMTGATATVYERLFAYLTGHSAQYFGDRFAGALTNKISNAARGIESLVPSVLWQFFPLAVGLIVDLVLLFTIEQTLGWALLGWIVVFFGAEIYSLRFLSRSAYAHAESSSTLRGKLVDSASNIESVQNAGSVAYERDYVGRFIDQQRAAHLQRWWTGEWILVLNATLLAVLIGLLSCLGVYLYGKDAITIGSLVLVISMAVNLERLLFFIGSQLTDAVGNYSQLREGLDELLQPHAIAEAPGAAPLVVSRGAVRFHEVNFQYGTVEVFDRLTLDIPAGQKVGLVGPSGAGKSTLINLLLRHYDVRSGQVSIDEQDVRTVTLESLRRAVAFVPQSTSLFHRSIRENIAYGCGDVSDDAVREAARLAEADEFIRRLPQGYESFVGERGVKLSGGQRQRISVARAILKNAPILVLDEATSALDSESEHAIQRSFATLMRGKTVIAIAHRLSTLRLMDRLVVIDRGAIVEEGSHAELVNRRGLYARLWEKQVSGFIQDEDKAAVIEDQGKDVAMSLAGER